PGAWLRSQPWGWCAATSGPTGRSAWRLYAATSGPTGWTPAWRLYVTAPTALSLRLPIMSAGSPPAATRLPEKLNQAEQGRPPIAKTRGKDLSMVWADIDPEYKAAYHRWYAEEHITRLLAIPGLLSAGRYVA